MKGKLIILLGSPGSGKSLQSEALQKHFKIPCISIGALLRKQAKNDTFLQGYISKGLMLPEEHVNKKVEELLKGTGFSGIIDGYPRSLGHATFLEKLLKKNKQEILCVINLDVSHEKLIARMKNRYVCSDCFKSFVSGPVICCYKNTEKRVDDHENIISQRINIHEQAAIPVVSFFKNKNRFISVDGESNPEEVTKEIIIKITQLSQEFPSQII